MIYVDSEFKCHATNPNGNLREVEHPFFDDKCDTFIEGYCYDDSEGYVQIYPWKDYSELDKIQRVYEKRLIADYSAALRTLGVSV